MLKLYAIAGVLNSYSRVSLLTDAIQVLVVGHRLQMFAQGTAEDREGCCVTVDDHSIDAGSLPVINMEHDDGFVVYVVH